MAGKNYGNGSPNISATISDICRIFYFHHKNTLYVATSGYIKKEMKTDQDEIEKAQKLRQIFTEEMA